MSPLSRLLNYYSPQTGLNSAPPLENTPDLEVESLWVVIGKGSQDEIIFD